MGMTFFPRDEQQQAACKAIIERHLEKFDLPLLGYRVVPVDNSDLGRDSAETEPSIQQIFIGKPAACPQKSLIASCLSSENIPSGSRVRPWRAFFLKG